MPIPRTGIGSMPENSAKRGKGPKNALNGSPRGFGRELFLADFWWRWRRGKEGEWRTVKASQENFLGYQLSRATTWQEFLSWFSAEDRERFLRTLGNVAPGGADRVDVCMRDYDREEHWVRVAVAKSAHRGTEETTLAFVVLGPRWTLAADSEFKNEFLAAPKIEQQLRDRVTRIVDRLRQATGRPCTLELTGDWLDLGSELGFSSRPEGIKLALSETGMSWESGKGAVAISFAGRERGWLKFSGLSETDIRSPHLQRTFEQAREELRATLTELWFIHRSRHWARFHELLRAAGRTLFADARRADPLRELCRAVGAALGARRTHLWFAEPPAEVYHLVAHWGFEREEIEALQVIEITGPLLEEGESQRLQMSPQLPRLPTEFAAGGGVQRAALRLEPGGVLVLEWAEASAVPRLDDALVEAVRVVASLWCFCTRLSVELDQATRVKSDFVATMSHELRTPLNTLMGYTDLLACEEFGPLTEEQRDVLDRMNHSARELLDLINATLDWGRFEAEPVALDVAAFSLPDLIAELDREIAYQRRRRGLHFVADIEPAAATVRTDRNKLKVILKNLLTNAVKFTEHGGVEVSARAVDNGVEIAVRDTGIGIDPAVLPVIFEPFRQGEPAATRRFGGVGLGLYVVRRLVEVLGGTVTVDSQPGRGSVFRVWLPAAPPAATS